jgi:hypothetical protein
VDLILFREGQLAKMIAYIRENPRRLGIKRAHSELFRVARDLEVRFAAHGTAQGDFAARGEAQNPACGKAQGDLAAHGKAQDNARGHFMAIGNHFLLDWPDMHIATFPDIPPKHSNGQKASHGIIQF